MEKWVKAIQQHQPDFNATTHSKICSMHFLESDYTLSLVNNQKVLKKTAIPSVFMNCKYLHTYVLLLLVRYILQFIT
jgi:hypothetical protein